MEGGAGKGQELLQGVDGIPGWRAVSPKVESRGHSGWGVRGGVNGLVERWGRGYRIVFKKLCSKNSSLSFIRFHLSLPSPKLSLQTHTL